MTRLRYPLTPRKGPGSSEKGYVLPWEKLGPETWDQGAGVPPPPWTDTRLRKLYFPHPSKEVLTTFSSYSVSPCTYISKLSTTGMKMSNFHKITNFQWILSKILVHSVFFNSYSKLQSRFSQTAIQEWQYCHLCFSCAI